ncbi:protein mono-ADP-ribosyltransferase PARP6-like isoform X2 [Coregonus clupeaformis]|uniref:protein mono-ADP-ribosyltransferase PARP6-like isoform X2 n=1 Tax=Coregonus clupeaformis TaxID=59861 RepID=UPI001E1C801B|nr:protein mono-ADP-ribosyltransferase PARP6-like isoform X2 [Coregonus clupeaformis]
MDVECQRWTNNQSDECHCTDNQSEECHWTDNQSDEVESCTEELEEFLCEIQEGCSTDLYRHPQLDMDIDSVKAIYTDTAVSVREYGSIDDVDVDMLINVSFLDDEVARAWKIIPTEPIIVRLRFSLSQYLNGPAPSVEVFQPSNREGFSLGLQLQKVLSSFASQQWKYLSNETLTAQQKIRHTWFKPGGTIKRFRAGLGILSPMSKSSGQEHVLKVKMIGPELKVNLLMNRTMAYTIKNPRGELHTYTTNGKRVLVSAARSPAHITTKQLVEVLFSSQAFIHCKSVPTLQHGFLVQVMKYAEQRIPTLNEYCVVCDERHVFQYGSMLKPAVCSRELCVFSFYTLGVMAGAVEEVSNGAEVVDLLVAMCRAALESSRKSIILEPYPSVVDPYNTKSLAFSPRRKSYDRLQKALDSIMTIREMTQQLKFMHTPHQFLLTSSPPAKEARFRAARKLYGSTFAFHGSHIENWHSILRNGLVNASCTKLQLHGAVYGKGIYLSPVSSIAYGYSGIGKGQHHITTKQELVKRYNRINTTQQERPGQSRFLQSRNLNCIALCEVITSKDLQKHGDTWVCPISDHVCTRFFFVYENGQVGDADINTQDIRIEQEIIRVIGTKPS